MTLDLSEVARQAVEADGSILVLGGPGAGKTTLSLLKARGLLPDLQPEQRILFLSFSRSAVNQVANRRDDLLRVDERNLIDVKTYHAFCVEVLVAHGRLLNGKSPQILFPREEQLRRSKFNGDWNIEQQRLAEEQAVHCFDQVARSCTQLLQRSVCVRDLIANRYPVIILDEFQDTSDSQWTLVKQFVGSSRIITLADPDQRIFEYDRNVDPKRLNQLRDFISPKEFDLGGENHRSPDAGILSFADSILKNRPLPVVNEVTLIPYYPNSFAATVHARIVWTLSKLRDAGIERPSLAVLCRTNSLVVEIDRILDQEHTLSGTTYKPIEHHALLDFELVAAAAGVVASILEWPDYEPKLSVMRSLETIAHYYELKNALKPSNTAQSTATGCREAILKLASGGLPQQKIVKEILFARNAAFSLTGDPVEDWKKAMAIVNASNKLAEIQTHLRLVPLLRAKTEIGGQLASEWLAKGTYGRAQRIVQRALDQRVLASSRIDPQGILLMTIHKSKGKEFDAVVLVEGAFNGQFFNAQKEMPPYEASRRLLRVAITRARHKVLIIRPHNAPNLISQAFVST